jgi:hypothetical protein
MEVEHALVIGLGIGDLVVDRGIKKNWSVGNAGFLSDRDSSLKRLRRRCY